VIDGVLRLAFTTAAGAADREKGDTIHRAEKESCMPSRPTVIAFDVIETLFPIEPLGERFEAIGLPAQALRLFFAQMLRDAFALEATARYKPFRELATASLEVTLASQRVAPDPAKIAQVLGGFGDLPAHPDVRPAFERARAGGARIMTLTNGGADNTRKLLAAAGLQDFVEKVVSIDEVRRWKPNREVYLHAARAAGVEPARLGLVAAHAWDTHGAKEAGLVTGWVRRGDREYHSAMSPPDARGETLTEAVDGLLALPAPR
jgi:2-haloacid dehalogenase